MPFPSGSRPALPRLHLAKRLLFVLSLVPLVRAVLLVVLGQKVNPVEFVQNSTGTWALSFLLITLGITPLRRLTGWNVLVRARRTLGLFAFFTPACTCSPTWRWTRALTCSASRTTW